MTSRLMTVAHSARDTVATTAQRVRRISAGVAAVRLIAGLGAAASLTLSLPFEMLQDSPPSVVARIAMAVAAAGAAVAVWPRTRWVSLVLVAAIASWLLATIGLGEPVGAIRVVLLAAALYVTHAGAAFAAVLPYDCLVAAGVLWRWTRRVGAVLGVSLVFGAVGILVTGQLPAARSVVGPIVGSVVAAGLAGLLAWQLRRRRG